MKNFKGSGKGYRYPEDEIADRLELAFSPRSLFEDRDQNDAQDVVIRQLQAQLIEALQEQLRVVKATAEKERHAATDAQRKLERRVKALELENTKIKVKLDALKGARKSVPALPRPPQKKGRLAAR